VIGQIGAVTDRREEDLLFAAAQLIVIGLVVDRDHFVGARKRSVRREVGAMHAKRFGLGVGSEIGRPAGAARVGSNVRVSTHTWDPDQPQQRVGGLTQYPCAGHTDPCAPGRGFIGDYFGLAISARNVYTFGVSTHYPSQTVRADDGGPVYYQNQVLGITARTVFGNGF